MKKQIILFIVFSGMLSLMAGAQEAITAAGETHSASGIELSWTLGEPMTETFTAGNNELTQGLHQTKLVVTAINEATAEGLEVKVYPNPTSDHVLIQFDKHDIVANYTLFDFLGKVLQQNIISRTHTRLDMKNYASGTYILRLTDINKSLIQQLKITKR